MKKVRAIYNTDKSVSIIHPAKKSRKVSFGLVFDFNNSYSIWELNKKLPDLDKQKIQYVLEPENEWLKRVFDKATPEGVEYEDIDSSEIPSNRKDRNAWEGEKGKGIAINQAKAKKLRDEKELKEKIEKEKQSILEEMAIERLKARNEI